MNMTRRATTAHEKGPGVMAVPLLRRLQITEHAMRQMTVEAPTRLLAK